MSQSWVAATTGAIVATATTLALAWPARWLDSWVWQASGQRVQMQQTQGPWWSGRTRLALWGGDGSRDVARIPGELAWRISPHWDQGPSLVLRVWAPCCVNDQLHVTVSWSSGWEWRIRDAHGQFDLTPLRGLGTPWNTLNLSGIASWRIDGTRGMWRDGVPEVQGRWRVELNRLSSDVSTLAPLGNYTVDWQWRKNASADWRLQTQTGVLQMAGQGQWSGRRLRFRGEASSSPEAAAALSNLLNIMGRRQGEKTILSIG